MNRALSVTILGFLVFTATTVVPARTVDRLVMSLDSRSVLPIERAQAQSAVSPADIYRNNIDYVFTIYSSIGLGAGFVIEGGWIVTNAHVVSDDKIVEVETQKGEKFKAIVDWKNTTLDFAMLRPIGFYGMDKTLGHLPTGPTPSIGDGVVVIGSPGGLKGTLTTGVVSQLYPDGVIQLNVAINHGNSGGPVFDLSGRVIGIATAKYSKGDGLGFAIPISYLSH